ncbi:NAD(P)/FAD-dependent oxidoreductase [Flavobacterium litorale]|uniref:FAD-binding oxidoreductase n=1 Tax=Flavobacterium litorale TaxID=2856519 RepID=A0ABX8V7G1_9FLAO|nr:FAD-dependent oxidoreductase [Flavobacterium litorale]QYJ68765.1 FAD-binding oxidoreductase [Flavobacterium litorale]
MKLSWWEINSWFTNVDYTIVGSGIVGLHTALRLRERFPDSKIIVLEKGELPQGASTKNAGFACFGSLSEIVSDLNNHTEQEVINLIQKRRNGLQLLRQRLGDAAIDYQQHGGYELFLEKDEATYQNCLQQLSFVNNVLQPQFNNNVFATEANTFGFKGIHHHLILNPFEGQIDTGKMMQALLKEAARQHILIVNCQNVSNYDENSDGVTVSVNNYTFTTKKLLFATNGFASTLTKGAVKPARAQVLITEPIPNLNIKGTFHMDEGYYYFRNYENRILFGGARNLDFEGETTTELAQTELIQNQLEQLLHNVILPNQEVKIAHCWSGVMGVGNQKNPIVQQLSAHTYCGVRLGGMGIAIGSIVGQELADLV